MSISVHSLLDILYQLICPLHLPETRKKNNCQKYLKHFHQTVMLNCFFPQKRHDRKINMNM